MTLEPSGAILHFPSVVTTLGYYYSDRQEKKNVEVLFAGDNEGFLSTFTLSVNEFWHVGTVESYIDLSDLPRVPHGVKYDGEWIHDNWVTKIQFYEDLGTLVTSSWIIQLLLLIWIETEKYGSWEVRLESLQTLIKIPGVPPIHLKNPKVQGL